jgi:23S rRNA pseudouridine2605 synthase
MEARFYAEAQGFKSTSNGLVCRDARVMALSPCGVKTRAKMDQVRNSERVGLARALSKLGYCSRSQAVALIREGRVQLNGTTRQNPETPVNLQRDRIEVDRRAVKPETRIYLMLNKPRGVVTTASDEKNRDTVYSCLGDELPWVGPVGRLDKATEGLLLFTNDSHWAAQISDPHSHVDKTYHVQVAALTNQDLEATLMRGVRTANGEMLRAKQVRVLRRGERNTWLQIALDEGKNRHIRRMFEALGIEVLRLVRVAVGPIELGPLAKGKFRALTASEKAAMDQAIRSSSLRPRP